jgi:hypothetical protein
MVNQLHPLVSVVVIALMAVLAGANGPTAIARWAVLKEDLLRKLLPCSCPFYEKGRDTDWKIC